MYRRQNIDNEQKQRAREAASRPQSRSHGGGASVGAEPAYVELPTNASGMTQFLQPADGSFHGAFEVDNQSRNTQAWPQWSAEEYQQWNEDHRSWSSWGYCGTQGWWSGKLQ